MTPPTPATLRMRRKRKVAFTYHALGYGTILISFVATWLFGYLLNFPVSSDVLAESSGVIVLIWLSQVALAYQWSERTRDFAVGRFSTMGNGLAAAATLLIFIAWYPREIWPYGTLIMLNLFPVMVVGILGVRGVTVMAFFVVALAATVGHLRGGLTTAHWVLVIVGGMTGPLWGLFNEYFLRQKQQMLQFKDELRNAHDLAVENAAALQKLDAQKTTFFQNVSHELRTPLTLILNPLEEESKESPKNKNLQVAAKNSRRLLRLVNQLLDFQKLDAGKKNLALEPVNLHRFAHVCADYFASACSTKGVDFQVSRDGQTLQPDADAVWIMGEVDGLEKVVFNYLSNALKYTPHDGAIELGLEAESKRVRLFVRDTGPGIAAHNQTKLFKVFSQVDETTTRAYEGTGLGLALVKSLATEMSGNVGVESEVGQGSTFWAEFPVCAAPEHEPAANFEVKGWLLAEDQGETGVDESTEIDALPDVENNSGALVLVVDDLPDMRNLIGASLAKRHYRVAKAPNGKRGLDIARNIQPDLIVTDWMMPQMTGPDLIRALKSDAQLQSVPVILLTAKSDEESKLIGTEIGADAFLGKPFNDQELGSLVRNLLSLKHREREVEELNHQLTENVLKRYLPPDLVEQIVSGETSLEQEPESTNATILFSDLQGFTKLSGKLRAKKLARVLNEYLSAMTDVIFEHGGTVDKFIGDAIMVIFGAPTRLIAKEQVMRAVKCAKAMQDAMVALNARWEEQGIPELKMRIGVHQGPVVVGTFGSAKRSDYTAIGPAVNMASRIEGVCPAGSVFISGEVCDYLDEAAAEEAGEYELKGVAGKQYLYRLLG